MVSQNSSQCPCESGRIYDKCCGPFLAGMASAPTAEALMRSRYTAYVEENSNYLVETWHADHRPKHVEATGGQKWLGLKIRRVEAGSERDVTGTVEFVPASRLMAAAIGCTRSAVLCVKVIAGTTQSAT